MSGMLRLSYSNQNAQFCVDLAVSFPPPVFSPGGAAVSGFSMVILRQFFVLVIGSD